MDEDDKLTNRELLRRMLELQREVQEMLELQREVQEMLELQREVQEMLERMDQMLTGIIKRTNGDDE